MSNWTEGYVTEIEYTHGYYRELSPSLQRVAVLLAGYAPPDERGAYLELGYGQGLSAAIHAAATPHQVWGTDFNPSQAAHAQSLIKAAGGDARLLDESFGELAARGDLPQFDYIGAHGVWSWISNENRTHITDILRRRLAVGGIFYVSYNCLPGWSAALPLRHLLSLHAETTGAETQGVTGRIDAALAFAQQLVDKNAAYFRANPLVVELLKGFSGQNRRYLAHEYFNRDWCPMPFSELAEWLSLAKLEFATSAYLLDRVDTVNLTADAQAMLGDIQHPILRESIRDYFVNQQFRRDIFIRGPRRLTALDRREALLATGFALLNKVEDVPLKATVAIGEATLNEAIYRPIIEALAKDGYRPRLLGQVKQDLPNMSFSTLLEAITVLMGTSNCHPAQSEEATMTAIPRTMELNAELCRGARSSGENVFLASPVIGAGVLASRFEQTFLLAMAEGRKAPEEWVQYTWQILADQGQSLLRDGKPMEKPEDNLAELASQARVFAEKRLPILKALGVAG
jgi:hypothetical protein